MLLSSAIGFLFGSHQINQNNAANFSNPSIEKLNRLMNYLSEDYVDKINTDSLVSVVIEDIVDELDPHSVIFLFNSVKPFPKVCKVILRASVFSFL